jgi:dTDP-4-dehydrorhamnose reductase
VLYPSSDYVFDGRRRRPYVESDLTGAISAYGRSKQAGETAVAAASRDHFIVRASWLFGVGGRNFVETMLRIGREQPEVVVVSDQVGCPTYTGHLAEALAELIETDEFGIHHIAGGGSASWFDFAQEIFDQADLDCRVLAGTTEMLARPAPRPSYSVLGSERAGARSLPDWRSGLAAYLAERDRAGIGASV